MSWRACYFVVCVCPAPKEEEEEEEEVVEGRPIDVQRRGER